MARARAEDDPAAKLGTNSGVDGIWRPVPRQENVQPVDRMAVNHALDHQSRAGQSELKKPGRVLGKTQTR
jgi:hypothetical protein